MALIFPMPPDIRFAATTISIRLMISVEMQGIIPYGAQLLMASGFAGIAATQIIPYLFYPFVLCAVACLSIIFRFPKRYS